MKKIKISEGNGDEASIYTHMMTECKDAPRDYESYDVVVLYLHIEVGR